MSYQNETATPLEATLAHINSLNPYFHFFAGPQQGEEWLPAADLFREGSPASALLDQMIASRPDRYYAAASILSFYITQPMCAAIGGYLSSQVIPDLTLENVALCIRPAEHYVAVAFQRGAFATVAGAQAAAHPHAAALPSPDALRQHYVAQLTESYIPPMVALLRARTSIGERALWANAADRLAGLFLWMAQMMGREACSEHEIPALVGQPPLRGKTGVAREQHGEYSELFVRRGSCCYSYRLPGQEYCLNCPVQPKETQRQRMAEYMQKTAQEMLEKQAVEA